MSQWTEHVKRFAKDNNVSYKDAMSLAKDSYQSQTKIKPNPKPKTKPNKKLEAILPPAPVKKAVKKRQVKKIDNPLPLVVPDNKPVKKRAVKKKSAQTGGTSHICAGCGFCNE